MEFLKDIQEYYGKSLSPQELESLKKIQEQYKGIIPQGTETSSGKKTLRLEDIKKIQEKMQEEYENIPLEERERIKQMQDQQENTTPPEIPGGNSDPNGGMGM
jgi:ADP-heptose:LPS heptosyltransferase